MSNVPPTDELRALIALEKDAFVDPGPARARLAERLSSQFQAAPSTHAAQPTSAARSRWWMRRGVVGLGGFGAGVAVTAIARSLWAPAPSVEIRYVDRVVEVERLPDASIASEASARPVVSAAPSLPIPVHRPPPSASAVAPSADEALARERQVIEKARSALTRHDPDAALRAVGEHAKEFPRGQLVEMREALAVQALADARRGPEAKARAERFHREFPASMYSPVVDAALSSIP